MYECELTTEVDLSLPPPPNFIIYSLILASTRSLAILIFPLSLHSLTFIVDRIRPSNLGKVERLISAIDRRYELPLI